MVVSRPFEKAPRARGAVIRASEQRFFDPRRTEAARRRPVQMWSRRGRNRYTPPATVVTPRVAAANAGDVRDVKHCVRPETAEEFSMFPNVLLEKRLGNQFRK